MPTPARDAGGRDADDCHVRASAENRAAEEIANREPCIALAIPSFHREWFLVPRFVVDDAVERIKDGTITDYVYDSKTARLVRSGS